jgi:hypothetical protein
MKWYESNLVYENLDMERTFLRTMANFMGRRLYRAHPTVSAAGEDC